jgi:enamine deaminase RidA (YjgF/YER057c/UK114 family)
LRDSLGSFDRLVRIVKLDVFVASAPSFTDQPAVANGASELFLEVLGDAGRHARAAVGVPSLPLGACVEVVVTAAVSDRADDLRRGPAPEGTGGPRSGA